MDQVIIGTPAVVDQVLGVIAGERTAIGREILHGPIGVHSAAEDDARHIVDQRLEPLFAGKQCLFSGAFRRLVFEHQHHAGHRVPVVDHRGGAVGDRVLLAVAREQQGVVGEGGHLAVTEHPADRGIDFAARGLADDAEDHLQRLPLGVCLAPAGQGFCHRIHLHDASLAVGRDHGVADAVEDGAVFGSGRDLVALRVVQRAVEGGLTEPESQGGGEGRQQDAQQDHPGDGECAFAHSADQFGGIHFGDHEPIRLGNRAEVGQDTDPAIVDPGDDALPALDR
ncbi:MAG: hypothetical protein BWX70_02796 [Verrucomicrobia bacterium ADurb.Bin070]|nr:MAG: hypothetical protein BWX70_02796 [Verrucomicrobia bacterium ADurb.Bin070]